LFSSIAGFSFYYVGLGGEMGADASNDFASGLPIIQKPWSTSGSASLAYWDEITDVSCSRTIAKTNNSWTALYWIGELYPDSAFGSWQANGNLSTGSGNYYRAHYDTTFTDAGQILTYQPFKRTGPPGSASLFNGKTSSGSGPFCHEGRDGDTASLTAKGSALASIFNIPLLTTISASRPFTLNYGGNYPPEWTNAIYSALRTTLTVKNIFYEAQNNASTYDASAEVKMTQGSDFCYFAMNGIDRQINFGSSQMGQLALACLIRQNLDAGLESSGWVSQVPLVDIVKPTLSDEFIDPVSIPIQWSAGWKRWNGSKYTEDYGSAYTESTALVFSVKYYNGTNWYYCSDNTPALPGVRDYPAHTTENLDMTWDVSSLGRGNYTIRIECYRRDYPQNYAYKQIQVYINR
jgi:hypothetical protein